MFMTFLHKLIWVFPHFEFHEFQKHANQRGFPMYFSLDISQVNRTAHVIALHFVINYRIYTNGLELQS